MLLCSPVGDTVHVHYKGTLTSGKQFDSSYQRGDPLSFVAGEGQVIKGWDEGLLGMKIGEKRKLTIAPELGCACFLSLSLAFAPLHLIWVLPSSF